LLGSGSLVPGSVSAQSKSGKLSPKKGQKQGKKAEKAAKPEGKNF
jgi:hypothetical protein